MIDDNEFESAVFLPVGQYRRSEMRTAVLRNLDATLDLLPRINSTDLTIKKLDTLPTRTYRLPTRPTASFLQMLPSYKGGTAEVGIFCLQKKWLMNLSDGLYIQLPTPLEAIAHDNIFQADMHSQPGSDLAAEIPDQRDIENLDCAVDRTGYLITEKGLVKYRKPAFLPGFSGRPGSDRAFDYWITKHLQVTEDQFKTKDPWQWKKDFHTQVSGLETVPWNQPKVIDNLLISKEKIPVNLTNLMPKK